MSSLVAELLELARLDRNSSLDLTDTDMAELVRDAVADANAVEQARAGQGALLEVTDAGQGMSEEAAARAFDRFYRGGHNGNGHGSGLGLSIVQAIAAAHGGHAMLQSAVGGGTSVQFWIPFRPAGQSEDGAEDPAAAGTQDPARHHLSRNCLLSFSLLSGYIFTARRN